MLICLFLQKDDPPKNGKEEPKKADAPPNGNEDEDDDLDIDDI